MLVFYLSLAGTRPVNVFLPDGRSTDIANYSSHMYTNVSLVYIYIRFPFSALPRALYIYNCTYRIIGYKIVNALLEDIPVL